MQINALACLPGRSFDLALRRTNMDLLRLLPLTKYVSEKTFGIAAGIEVAVKLAESLVHEGSRISVLLHVLAMIGLAVLLGFILLWLLRRYEKHVLRRVFRALLEQINHDSNMSALVLNIDTKELAQWLAVGYPAYAVESLINFAMREYDSVPNA